MANENHADFTPTIPDSQVTPTRAPYVPVGSFKFWAQKVLPTVYDDSLSYYEVLTKLVWHINKMIEDMDNFNQTIDSTLKAYGNTQDYVNSIKNTMIATYNQLQEYVNHYFDNLDVQDEINAKLDAMADSGELTTLLAPFIPDLVTQWLNNHVTPTSPIIDGSLTISGAGADAKVTGDKFNGLQKELNGVENFVSDSVPYTQLTYRYISSADGSIVEGSGHVAEFNVAPKDSYYIETIISNSVRAIYAFYTKEGVLVGTPDPAEDGDNKTEKRFVVVPDTAYIMKVGSYFPNTIVVKRFVNFDSFANIYTRLSELSYPDGVSVNYNLIHGGLVNGLYRDADGVYVGSRTDYIAFPNLVNVEGFNTVDFLCSGPLSLTFHIIFFDKYRTYISNQVSAISNKSSLTITLPSGCSYIGISGSYTYQYTLDPNDYSFFLYHKYFPITTDSKLEELVLNNRLGDIGTWSNNIYFYGDGARTVTTTRIGLDAIFIPNTDMYLSCDTGYNLAVLEFSANVESVSTEISNTGWVSSAFLSKNGYYIINFRKVDNSTISPVNRNNPYIQLYKIGAKTPNYSIGVMFERHYFNLKKLGVIGGEQSFCKYNDKYYSTDGDNIYVNGSDFTLLQTIPLDVGHANSMQVGMAHPNYAYISGWNDSTIYIVDLDNIQIVDTITVPITNTLITAAIDDINKLLYLFNGSATSLSGEDIYDFVVYDYDGEQIISSKKITAAFGAMQSCDFVDGKIIAINGTGSVEMPNGYRVYNTNGDILGEYVLGSLLTSEPEGVYIDRITKDIYLSDVNRNVYILKQVN